MTQEKREFVEEYIKYISEAVDSYNSSEPALIAQTEDDLFDRIIEVGNVFSKELPNIKDAVFQRNGSGIRDAYCQNEAGIIWFLDTEEIIITMPEIDSNHMEGFLNSEHKIRRLNIKSDVSAICDIVKKYYELIPSSTKLNANIDRLIEQYNEAIKQ